MSDQDEQTNTVDIGCMQAIETLYAYLDGELDDPNSVREFEHHMSHCRSCYTRAEIEGLLTERMRQSSRQKAPEALQSRLQELLRDL